MNKEGLTNVAVIEGAEAATNLPDARAVMRFSSVTSITTSRLSTRSTRALSRR